MKTAGLSRNQLGALAKLTEPMTAKELAEVMQMPSLHSEVERTLHSLRKRKLVTYNETNHRYSKAV